MKKRFLSVLLAMLMVISLMPAALATDDLPTGDGDGEGETPAAVEFYCEFDEKTETLTIYGSGEMPEASTFTKNKFPWKTYQTMAKKIIVSDGITTIAAKAFQTFKNVTELILPTSLTTISESAFQNCNALTTNLELTGVDIGKSAFAGCKKLTSVTLTNCTVASTAFTVCERLTSVVMKNCKIAANAFSSAFAGNAATLEFTECNILGNIYGNTDNNVEKITLTDCAVAMGAFSAAFSGARPLKSVVVTGGTLDKQAFYNNVNLESVTLSNVTVGSMSFYNCSSLKDLSIEGASSVGSRAFDNCTAVEELSVSAETKLGYSAIFLSKKDDGTFKFPELAERVENILKDKFYYEDVPEDAKLTVPDGWESSNLGENNGVTVDTNQITKAAKWVDEDKTTAEVQLQFSHVGRPGTDFVFLLDYSSSMTALGNTDDGNSRFYNMQSKVADVATKLLSTEGYDNRVAIVSFGGNTDDYDETNIKTTVETMEFTADADEAYAYIMADNPYTEDTDYSTGLEKAEKLINARTVTTRTPVIIFISDGMPNVRTADHAAIAKRIREEGIDIFGVMQSVPLKQEAKCSAVMQEICSDGLFFKASDTGSFSDAVNAAVGASYGYFTVTDAINTENFSFVDGSIKVSDNNSTTAAYNEETNVITWNLNGIMPYKTYTLTFRVELNQVNDRYPNGTFDTNSAESANVFSSGSTEASNTVASPSLTHENKKSKKDHSNSSGSTTRPTLNTKDHYGYIIGYPDGTVQPNGQITRAEATTIFFRLLTDEVRDENLTKANNYSDVAETAWYNTAVSTMTKAGIVDGYPDGTFRPDAPITRAEMAKIISLFAKLDKSESRFSDIVGHWAEAYIMLAAGNGWIEGYPDGTFGPQRNITRAETTTMINRVLDRVPSEESRLLSRDVMQIWPDSNPGDWFYLAMQEATNSHDYKRNAKWAAADEQWTALRETRDWKALEQYK